MTTDIKHETKQNASHTPGQWTAKITPAHWHSAMPHKVFGAPHTDGSFYAPLCTVSNEADAHLIASAPRLLEALVAVVTMEYDRDPESRNFDEERLESFAALIAEAKGLAV